MFWCLCSCAYIRSRPHSSNPKEATTVKTESSLTTMSDNEIRKLLDNYGIKHGPVIGEWVWTPTLTVKTLITGEAPQWLQELKLEKRNLIVQKKNSYHFFTKAPPEVFMRGSWVRPCPRWNRCNHRQTKLSTEKRVTQVPILELLVLLLGIFTL